MSFYQAYSDTLHSQLSAIDSDIIDTIADDILNVWKNKQRVFICGNGGSAANALHIANDFSYGVNPNGRVIDVEALTANNSIITCLANDTGYEYVFSKQIESKAKSGDILLVLSGSGNSKNVINAVNQAKKIGVKTHAIVGYSGGSIKNMADIVVHSDINDMQIAEDIQLIIGHWLMRKLHKLLSDEQQ